MPPLWQVPLKFIDCGRCFANSAGCLLELLVVSLLATNRFAVCLHFQLQEFADAEGTKYYYNAKTGLTQWDRPPELEPPTRPEPPLPRAEREKLKEKETRQREKGEKGEPDKGQKLREQTEDFDLGSLYLISSANWVQIWFKNEMI